MANDFDAKGALKAMAIAVIIVLIGFFALLWQYQRLEKERLPRLEEELERQEEEMEKMKASASLERFLDLRTEDSALRARAMLAEGAMEQLEKEEFLMTGFNRYKIMEGELVGENRFRFMVAMKDFNNNEIVEIIYMSKILDSYYVDSVEVAG